MRTCANRLTRITPLLVQAPQLERLAAVSFYALVYHIFLKICLSSRLQHLCRRTATLQVKPKDLVVKYIIKQWVTRLD
jgi:hypothetical protein